MFKPSVEFPKDAFGFYTRQDLHYVMLQGVAKDYRQIELAMVCMISTCCFTSSPSVE